MASFWPFDQRLSPPTYARTDERTSRLRPARTAWNRMTATKGNTSRNRRYLPILRGILVRVGSVLLDKGVGIIRYLLNLLVHFQSCAIRGARCCADGRRPPLPPDPREIGPAT